MRLIFLSLTASPSSFPSPFTRKQPPFCSPLQSRGVVLASGSARCGVKALPFSYWGMSNFESPVSMPKFESPVNRQLAIRRALLASSRAINVYIHICLLNTHRCACNIFMTRSVATHSGLPVPGLFPPRLGASKSSSVWENILASVRSDEALISDMMSAICGYLR